VDADSKLVINWLVGGRDKDYAIDFVADTKLSVAATKRARACCEELRAAT